VHAGCFELFGTKRVNAIRDLKGKTVAVPAPTLGSSHHNFIASMAAYVGVDPKLEINFVTHPVAESARLLAEEKVDALMGFPPFPRSSGRRRSAMSLSIAASTVRGRSTSFVRRHPVATKRADVAPAPAEGIIFRQVAAGIRIGHAVEEAPVQVPIQRVRTPSAFFDVSVKPSFLRTTPAKKRAPSVAANPLPS
jgi:hypothetical protein